MTKINKKGLSLVELMMVIAIGGVILTTAGVQGFNAYQNSLDNGVRGDLTALSNATQAFMVDTNGQAPLWHPDAYEGMGTTGGIDATVVRTLIGANPTLSYDFRQGRNDNNLDFDGTVLEVFTPNNILIPTYMDTIPTPRRGGHTYIYVKGNSVDREGAQAFAYSSIVAGPKAQDLVNDNVSVINSLGVAELANEANVTDAQNGINGRLAACTLANLNMGATIAINADAGLANDLSIVYGYTGVMGAANAVSSAAGGLVTNSDAARCDLYSEGLGIRTGNFANDNYITVNSRN